MEQQTLRSKVNLDHTDICGLCHGNITIKFQTVTGSTWRRNRKVDREPILQLLKPFKYTIQHGNSEQTGVCQLRSCTDLFTCHSIRLTMALLLPLLHCVHQAQSIIQYDNFPRPIYHHADVLCASFLRDLI